MARAMKCSRCGVYYDDYSTNVSNRSGIDTYYNALFKIDKDLNDEYYGRECIDLCPSCKKSFEEWLVAGTKEANNDKD